MPYQNAHVKVNLIGTAFGAEEWTTGFRIGQEGDGSGNFSINEGWMDALLPLWQTFFTSTAVGINEAYKTTHIKAAIILPTGKTDLANVATRAYPTPITGGKTGSPLPPQISLVAQLAAASPVGLGSKGRMYLPGIAHAVDGGGGVSGATTLAIANALRTFLDGVESAAGSPGYIINASKGRPGVPFTAPVNRRVTTVRVGNYYDTQRRRRNGFTETYSAAALAA